MSAGADIVAAVDMWQVAHKTYVDNFADVSHFDGRCEDLRPESMKRKIGHVDLLLASPECTSHTCAKGSAPRSEESRETAIQVVRYAEVFKPRWIVVENVVHMRTWDRYEEFLTRLRSAGYNLRTQVLNAADFGVPQSRRRLFITADRECDPPQIALPKRKRRAAAMVLEKNGKYPFSELGKAGRAEATLRRAQRAIDVLGKDAEFLMVYYGSDAAGGWQRLSAPLRTITTIDRFALVRPTASGHEMRMLQVDELKRAMGFPARFKMQHGTRRDKVKMLGNAVCPPVMEAVVRQLTKTNGPKEESSGIRRG